MFFHGLEQRALGFGRGSIDLIGQHQLRKNRTALKSEFAGFAVKDGYTEDVGGQQIAGELHALKGQSQSLGDGMREGGLAHARECPRSARWPRASRQARHMRICASLPKITRLIWARTASISDCAGFHWPLSAVTLAICAANWRISMRSSESRCWSLATTSGRRIPGEIRHCSACLIFCRSTHRPCVCRFARRSSSAAGSIRPAMGTNISSVPEQRDGRNRRSLRPAASTARRFDAGKPHQVVQIAVKILDIPRLRVLQQAPRACGWARCPIRRGFAARLR